MIFATPIIILLLIVSFILSITLIFRGYNQRARYKEENQKLWDKYIQKTGFYYKPRAKKIWIIFLVIMVGLIMAITIYSSFNQHEKASFLEKKENVIMTFLAKNYPEAKFYDITPSNNYLEKGKTHYFRVKSKKYLGHYFSVDVTKENIVNLNEADLKKAKQDLLFREKYFNNFDMNKMIFNFYLNGVIGYINVKENPQQLLEFLIKVFEIYHNINDPQKVYIKINLTPCSTF